MIRAISADITTAIAGGTFFDEYDTHLSRSPMVVDGAGWGEVTQLLSRTTEELFEIQARVERRRAEGGAGPSIEAKVELLQFRSPRPAAG